MGAGEFGLRCRNCVTRIFLIFSRNLRKVRELLDKFEQLEIEVFYFALDLSRYDLAETIRPIATHYHFVKCFGICGTFNDARLWSKRIKASKCFLSFGATFGNDMPSQASKSLMSWAGEMNSNDYMIVGMDACKNESEILRAYNDDQNVWHAFIRGGFTNSNQVLQYDWYRDEDWDLFGEVKENPTRHQFTLRALRDLDIPHLNLQFEMGEQILTYTSYKYDPTEMCAQFKCAGMAVEGIWKAPNDQFCEYPKSLVIHLKYLY